MRESLAVIWDALEYYREDCIPEAAEIETYNEEWDEICTAMARIHEALGIPHFDID